MNKIWKYTIEVDTKSFKMPRGATVLTIQTQPTETFELPCVWVMFDEAMEDESNHVVRDVLVVGTGHGFDTYDYEYVGTFQNIRNSVALVWHVFISPELA